MRVNTLLIFFMDITPVFIKITFLGIDAYFLILIVIVLWLIFIIFKRSVLKPNWRKIILSFLLATVFIILTQITIRPQPTIFEKPSISFLEFIKILIKHSYYGILIITIIIILFIAYLFSCFIFWLCEKLIKKTLSRYN